MTRIAGVSGREAGLGATAWSARCPHQRPNQRPGRRPGASTTREATLSAASSRFAEHGYDGATIRGIASDAGTDRALVLYFFRSKQELFAAAMGLPTTPAQLLAGVLTTDGRRLGVRLRRLTPPGGVS